MAPPTAGHNIIWSRSEGHPALGGAGMNGRHYCWRPCNRASPPRSAGCAQDCELRATAAVRSARGLLASRSDAPRTPEGQSRDDHRTHGDYRAFRAPTCGTETFFLQDEHDAERGWTSHPHVGATPESASAPARIGLRRRQRSRPVTSGVGAAVFTFPHLCTGLCLPPFVCDAR